MPAAARLHLTKGLAHQHERGAEVDGHHPAEVRGLQFRHGSAAGIDAGAVDEDVDGAELFLRVGNEFEDRFFRGETERAGQGRGVAGEYELRGEAFQLLFGAAADGEARASGGELQSKATADSGSGAGEENGFVSQWRHWRVP